MFDIGHELSIIIETKIADSTITMVTDAIESECGCTGNCGQSCSGGCESGCSGDCGRSCAGTAS